MGLDYIDVKYFKYAVGSNIGKETSNDIASRCILCGDSKDGKKKRLHLFTKPSFEGSVIHCFNCEFTGNMFSFLKSASPHLYEQYKQEKRNSSFEWLKSQHPVETEQEFEEAEIWLGTPKKVKSLEVHNNATETTSKVIPTVTPEANVNNYPPATFKFPLEFMPANESDSAIKYLSNREIDCADIYFSNDWLNFRGRKMPLKNCLIIPLWANEEEGLVYGFQARNTETKFFYTYIPEENTGYKVWNHSFNISEKKTVFCFESVFDAKSSGLPTNKVIAALGADLNDERISDYKEVIFCLDNQFKDTASKMKSQELLKAGHRVFIWPVTVKEKDANEWKQNNPTKNFAIEVLLPNIYSGTKGILKIKLRK